MVAAASQGLGFAIARTLAAEGANVSIAARNQATIDTAAAKISGGEVLASVLDVRSRESIEAWYAATAAKFPGVDILVTNSGGPPAGPATSFEDDAWQGAFELLLLSTIRMVRTVLPSMTERGGGSILMLSSSSVKSPIPNLALSNVIRAAVSALSKNMADELAPKKIRVNQLVPGRIATDRLAQLDEGFAKRAGITVEEAKKRSMSSIPLGRYGEPDEFAAAAAFLVSDAAAYITGATLQVDGGSLRTIV